MKDRNLIDYFKSICFVALVLSVGSLKTTIAVADDDKSGSAMSLPAGIAVESMSANVAKIELKSRYAYRQILLTGKVADGQSVDLTRMAKLVSAAKHVALKDGLIRPVSDGDENLKFEFKEHTVEIAVSVRGMGESFKPSFIRDVQPVFSKLGCNAGTCHGSKDGKNGFKLSLRGYDSIYDYRSFTDDIGARRFNRVAPDQSLMLLKASGSSPHVGGQLTSPGEPYYQMLRDWIAQGVQFDLDTSPRVSSIDILPKNPILPRANVTQQMTVMATYTDGTVRDVTQEAFIESGDIELIEALDNGVVKVLRRGEAPILVRYEGNYAATTLTVMGDRSGFKWIDTPTNNYIDKLVYEKLKRVKILPSDICSDADYVRRLYLDLTGLPPSANQVRAFIKDPRDSKVKRNELINQLVGNREFVEYWTNKWSDLLQVNRKFLGEEGATALRNWIKQNVATNKRYDEFAYDVLTASGSTLENPPAAYFKTLRDPVDLMENTTHLFLAVRFNCNKCHDHPFERWTQDQYYELAAYFAQIGRKEDAAFAGKRIGGSAVEGAKPLVEVIFDRNSGEVKHDRTQQVSKPSFPYSNGGEQPTNAIRREALAKWITSKDNRYFASSFVNRVWGYLIGTGIIEPIDDIRAGNPPTNPALLAALTKDFVEHDFDVQHLIKVICQSRVYQHSIISNEWNEDDTVNYSHSIPRRLPAEVLFDAIHFSSGSEFKIPGVAVGLRATELPDAGIKVPFLDDFGKPVRESACECERSSTMVLGPIMKLVNGPTVANALADKKNALHKLVKEIDDDDELIKEIFLRFLARFPNEQEVKIAKDMFGSLGQEFDAATAALKNYEATIPAKQKVWEAGLRRQVAWTPMKLAEFKSKVGAKFEQAADHSVFVSGALNKDVYSFTATPELKKISGLRLEAMNDSRLAAGGPGRAENGNFVLSELKLNVIRKATPDKPETVKLQNASATFSQSGWAVGGAIDGNPGTGWAVSPQFNKTHIAAFETAEDIVLKEGDKFSFEFVSEFPDGKHLIGKFRLSATEGDRPIKIDGLKGNLAKLIVKPESERSELDQKTLRAEYMKTDKQYVLLQQLVKQAQFEKENPRLVGLQDLCWALINNPSFLFNR